MITKEIQRAVLEWIANGRTGSSSLTMAFWLGFVIRRGSTDHPEDPADFNRCLGLLKAVPELREYLFRMGKLTPTWTRMIFEWESIESTFLDEAGLDWSKSQEAPKTYALMKRIIAAK